MRNRMGIAFVAFFFSVSACATRARDPELNGPLATIKYTTDKSGDVIGSSSVIVAADSEEEGEQEPVCGGRSNSGGEWRSGSRGRYPRRHGSVRYRRRSDEILARCNTC